MTILVIGADGFIGRNLKKMLSQDYDVLGADFTNNDEKNYQIDLLDKISIAKVLQQVKPQIVVNCAGIVDNSEKANLNPLFVQNLSEEIVNSGLKLKQIITLGSAAEYGEVANDSVSVDENTPLNAKSVYGLSKIKELEVATYFRNKYDLPIVTVRIFNPIGVGMNPRLLIPNMLQQINEIKQGERKFIEIARLDSKRDYIDVKDVALAIKTIVAGHPKDFVYNIGSGVSISNLKLLELMIKDSKLQNKPKIIETSSIKEPLVAAQANISRMLNEFSWKPLSTIEKTIKEIINASE